MISLMKVDDQYNPIKTNILMLPELPHIYMAYRMLYQEKKHKDITRLNTIPPCESLTFAVNKRQFYDKSSTSNRFYKPTVQDSRNRSTVGSKRNSLLFVITVSKLVIPLSVVLNLMVIPLISSTSGLSVVLKKVILSLMLLLLD